MAGVGGSADGAFRSGCLQPRYAEAAHPGPTADRRAIAVDPIKHRIEHYLGDDLMLDLNGGGAAPL
ncbi:MAG: hypothetical protein ACLQE9_06920 [Roseiarcus sp.]